MNYQAYDLCVRCALPLPDLFPAAAKSSACPDIFVRAGEVVLPWGASDVAHRVQITRAEAWLFWPLVGTFHLREGREIVVAATNNVAPNTLGACLTGPVLAIALYQRGFLMLHASAIALRDEIGAGNVVGFLGDSGAGKSTMAAALHARGHEMFADDFLAIPLTNSNAAPLIAPGIAQLNLWPNSLRALHHDSDKVSSCPPLWAHEDKRAQIIDTGFAQHAIPLRKLYVLETADTMSCRSLSAVQALTQLIRHSYCAGFLPPDEMAQQFQQCATLIQRVPVCRLERPLDLGQLSAVAQEVETDFYRS